MEQQAAGSRCVWSHRVAVVHVHAERARRGPLEDLCVPLCQRDHRQDHQSAAAVEPGQLGPALVENGCGIRVKVRVRASEGLGLGFGVRVEGRLEIKMRVRVTVGSGVGEGLGIEVGVRAGAGVGVQ